MLKFLASWLAHKQYSINSSYCCYCYIYIHLPFIFVSDSWASDQNIMIYYTSPLGWVLSTQINLSIIKINIVSTKLHLFSVRMMIMPTTLITHVIKTPISLLSNIQLLTKFCWSASENLVQAVIIFHVDYSNSRFTFVSSL